MDAVVSQLNQQMTRIESTLPQFPAPSEGAGSSPFSQVLDNKIGVEGMGKPRAIAMDSSVELSQNIPEVSLNRDATPRDLGNYMDKINGDYNELDRIINLMSSGETALSPRQMLAMQTQIHKMVLQTETVVRVTESGSKNIQTFMNMQI
jgi:hypothetical protein